MIKEKQLQTQHLVIKMLNDKCLTTLHSECLALHIHVVIVAHLNNFSETDLWWAWSTNTMGHSCAATPKHCSSLLPVTLYTKS